MNREGYSRQRVDVSTRLPIERPYGFIGRGPGIGGIDSAREFQEKIASHIAVTTGTAPAEGDEEGAPTKPITGQSTGLVALGEVE